MYDRGNPLANVFYNRQTRGLKQLPFGLVEDDHPVTVYFTESTVYTICSEGALYSSPRYLDGSFDPEDWCEVDFAECEAANGTVYHTMLTAIQDCLEVDAIHDPSGWYFKKAA